MTYTPVTAKAFREKKGSLSEKINAELTLLDAAMVRTEPPTNMKKITNLYYDPTSGELRYTAEA